MNIWTMTLVCVGGFYLEEPTHKICELNSNITLDELCEYILNIFGFDNDHMHRFLISRNGFNGQELENESISLEDLYLLEKSNALFMNFDFGDDWLFRISKTTKKAVYSSAKQYPCVVEEVCKNPEQYPMLENEY